MGRFSKLELGSDESPRPNETGPAGEALSPLAREDEQYDPPSLLRRGLDRLFDGDPREALRLFGKALQGDSTLLEAWIGQIDALLALDQIREADVWTTRALGAFPDDPTLLSLRGVLMARQGMLKRAIGTSDFALSKGQSLRSWIARGEILLTADNANAAACLDKAAEQIHAGDWMNLARVGTTWMRHRRWAQAHDVLLRAAAAEPRRAQLWRHLAECQMRLGFTEQAMNSQRRVLELVPGDRRAEAALHRLAKTGPLTRLWRRIWRR